MPGGLQSIGSQRVRHDWSDWAQMHAQPQCSPPHNLQQLGHRSSPDAINRGMDKEAVVHIHSGILLSHKKEHIRVRSNEMDEPRAYYIEWSKSEGEKQILYTKAMAPHSSTLAWKIPWMEEPGGLQSMGSLRVGHDWVTSLSLSAFMHWRRKWQPTAVFLPGESHWQRSLVGCSPWGCTESDTTEATWQQRIYI